VQGLLEGALARLAGEPIVTTVAGRTDAGVHAVGQVVSCDVPLEAFADPGRVRQALDRLCGPEVTVWAVKIVDAAFDARFSALQRRYVYRLCDAQAMPPLWRHDTWHAGAPPLDVEAMNQGALALMGEHDFSSFCRRAGDEHLVRRIDRLDVHRAQPDLVLVEVDGPAFCHQMVRSIVGCLRVVGTGRRPPASIAQALAARDRAAAGPLAPPHGLTLLAVDY